MYIRRDRRLTLQFYVLPEGYLVTDPSLKDIIHVLNPHFKSSSLPALSALPAPSYTLDSKSFLPGYVGLNNMKEHDYLNVILQLFLHVPPVRSFFLDPATPQLKEDARPTELVKRLATLAKRLWNPHLFKSQVSPHEFLQEVGKRSAGKFKITERGDPVEFLGWLVNTLHRDLGGTKKRGSSVIYSTFQGKVQIETQQVITHKEYSRPIFDVSRGELRFTVNLGQSLWHRHTKSFIAIPLPRPRFACYPSIYRCQREEDYSSSCLVYHSSQIRRKDDSRIRPDIEATSFDGVAAVLDTAHQAIYEEQLCRGEEPYHCQLSSQRCRAW